MRKLSLLTILGIALAVSAGVAAASATAKLTATEYQQLTALQNATSTTNSLKSLGAFQRAGKSCRKLSPVSGLMRAERTDCQAGFAWLEASIRTLQRVKACSKTTTVNSRFSCLMSSYVTIKGTVIAMYHAEKRLYSASVRRGFGHSCILALGDGKKTISYEAKMTKDITNMVSAMHARKLLPAQKWGSLYDAATASMESAASTVRVSVCPHQ